MRLKRLSLRHFRNLGAQELEIPDDGVALIGENAQGKTNVLEAIYYLETFRSFRGARDDQLVQFGEDVFRIAAGVEGGEDEAGEVTAAFQKTGRRKKVTVGGHEPDRLSDALGTLGAVVFSPADVALVNEGPSERRRFLDIVLSLNAEGYLSALQGYRHALSQRNAALRDDQPEALVAVWNASLVEAGAKVMWTRRRWIEGNEELFGAYYARVSGGRAAHPDYRPSVALDGAGSEEECAEAFRAALDRARNRERRMGTTVVGPHRDEMGISLEGDRELQVREFGSGGQRRTAALALRLIEARTIRERRGVKPLILLDDVFAELDAGRSERVLALLEGDEAGQVIVTAPKESDLRVGRDRLPRWRITAGAIEA